MTIVKPRHDRQAMARRSLLSGNISSLVEDIVSVLPDALNVEETCRVRMTSAVDFEES